MTRPLCRVCRTPMLTDTMTEPEELQQGRDLCAAWKCPKDGCRVRFVERVSVSASKPAPPPESREPVDALVGWGPER